MPSLLNKYCPRTPQAIAKHEPIEKKRKKKAQSGTRTGKLAAFPQLLGKPQNVKALAFLWRRGNVSGKSKILGRSSGRSGKLGDAWRSFAVALLLSKVTILARSPPFRHTRSSLLHHSSGAKMPSVSPLRRVKLIFFDISYITTPNDHMSRPKSC